VDIAMLGRKFNKTPVLLYYDQDFQGQNPLRLLRNIFNGMLGFDEEPMPPMDSADTWVIGVCRSDFSREGFLSLNHYIPIWTRQQMGSVWEDVVPQTQGKLEKRIASTFKKLELESEDSDSGGEARKASLREQLESLLQKKKFIDLLIDMDLFPTDVPGDGNCLLWSILALQAGPVVRTFLSDKQKVIALRQDAWFMCSGCVEWFSQPLQYSKRKKKDRKKHILCILMSFHSLGSILAHVNAFLKPRKPSVLI
jgi:hypothetical protein